MKRIVVIVVAIIVCASGVAVAGYVRIYNRTPYELTITSGCFQEDGQVVYKNQSNTIQKKGGSRVECLVTAYVSDNPEKKVTVLLGKQGEEKSNVSAGLKAQHRSKFDFTYTIYDIDKDTTVDKK